MYSGQQRLRGRVFFICLLSVGQVSAQATVSDFLAAQSGRHLIMAVDHMDVFGGSNPHIPPPAIFHIEIL